MLGFFVLVYLASLLVIVIHATADLNGSVFAPGDDIWFQPIVYNFARSGELIHPFMSAITPNEQGLVLWHGWLMPEVQGGLQGLLLPNASFAEIRFSGHILSAVIFTGFSFFFLKIFGPIKALITAPIFLCLLLYQVGRPELIGSGVLLGYLLSIRYAGENYKTALTAACIALTVVTSPILGVFLSLLTAFIIFSSDISRRTSWRSIGKIFVLVPLFTVVLTIAFTDLNFGDWLTGIIKHARHIDGRSDPSFLQYFIANLPLPLIVVFLIYFLLWALPALEGKRLEAQLTMLILIFGIYYGSVRLPPAVYNFAWLIPAILYFDFVSRQSRKPTVVDLFNGLLLAVLFVTFSLSTAVYTSIYYENISSGRNANQLVGAVHRMPTTTTFAIDSYSLPLPALMWFEIDNDRFIFDPEQRTAASHRIEFQAYFQNPTPNLKDGECVVKQNFHQTRYNIFGGPYQYSPLDWAFAIIQTRDC